MNQQKYAFFDFDNTLAKGDSVVPFLLFCISHHYASVFHLIKTIAAWSAYHIRRSQNYIPVKEVTFSFLKGKEQEEIDQICKEFVDVVLSKKLYPAGISEIKQLKGEGYKIYLVSASSDLYMKHIVRILPVDHVLATECEISDGRYTGKMGINCKGEEKKQRILNALQQLPNREYCVCYGDSQSDIPMLALGKKQYIVNPRGSTLKKMLPTAEIKKWKVKRK